MGGGPAARVLWGFERAPGACDSVECDELRGWWARVTRTRAGKLDRLAKFCRQELAWLQCCYERRRGQSGTSRENEQLCGLVAWAFSS
jgi:hypothetical protein